MKTYRVKMKTLSAGPNGMRLPDKVYPVSYKEARALVDGHYATAVDPLPELEGEPVQPAEEAPDPFEEAQAEAEEIQPDEEEENEGEEPKKGRKRSKQK